MGQGDILLLFTDGFTDQKNGELNYTASRLEEQLRAIKSLSSQEIFRNIREDFRKFCPDPDDDATMIIIKKL